TASSTNTLLAAVALSLFFKVSVRFLCYLICMSECRAGICNKKCTQRPKSILGLFLVVQMSALKVLFGLG
ncbi:MAG: hypothetical protein ACK51D_15895, partial [Cyclobacteriaceae bacterium]